MNPRQDLSRLKPENMTATVTRDCGGSAGNLLSNFRFVLTEAAEAQSGWYVRADKQPALPLLNLPQLAGLAKADQFVLDQEEENGSEILVQDHRKVNAMFILLPAALSYSMDLESHWISGNSGKPNE